MRALILEDSRAVRAILRRMLAELGVLDVAEAGSGVEGLQLLADDADRDVALIDLHMPEMDGLEFVRAVRADPALRRIRLVMITTEGGADAIRAALDAGADEYVTKPFTSDVIRDKLAAVGVGAES